MLVAFTSKEFLFFKFAVGKAFKGGLLVIRSKRLEGKPPSLEVGSWFAASVCFSCYEREKTEKL